MLDVVQQLLVQDLMMTMSEVVVYFLVKQLNLHSMIFYLVHSAKKKEKKEFVRDSIYCMYRNMYNLG